MVGAVLQKLRGDALSIFLAGVEAVEPRRAVLSHLSLRGDTLLAGEEEIELPSKGRILVVGAGKAAAPMAAAIESLLGERPLEGLVVVKEGHLAPLERVEVREARHPLPDMRGQAAAHCISELLRGAGEEDLVICLLSGGGSALIPLPAPPVSLEDKEAATRLLLECGAAIEEINCVRKHLSLLKGGGLARLAAPARVLTLILSDVVGDRLDVIASGPTAPDPTTFEEALEVLRRYGLGRKVTAAVHRRLRKGATGEVPETPKPDSLLFRRVSNLLVGSNAQAVAAAAARARELGYTAQVLTTRLTGEAREVARVFAATAEEMAASGRPLTPPACLVSGGEPTVTIRGAGRGGRSQEFALAAAFGLQRSPASVILSAGTDGTDGPTDAAGALVDRLTVKRAREAGLDPSRALEENDAYPLFQALGDLVITGPTNTNVMDLQLVLVGRP